MIRTWTSVVSADEAILNGGVVGVVGVFVDAMGADGAGRCMRGRGGGARRRRATDTGEDLDSRADMSWGEAPAEAEASHAPGVDAVPARTRGRPP